MRKGSLFSIFLLIFATNILFTFMGIKSAEFVWVNTTTFTNLGTDTNIDRFGDSVSFHSDKIAVGVPYAKIGSTDNVGRVDIFEFISGTWQYTQSLNMTDDGSAEISGMLWGYSVSISDSYLVVGAPHNTNPGRVYFYDYDSGSFVFNEYINAGFSADQFGTSVYLDGTKVAVGAPGNASSQGAVYIYENSGSSWSSIQSISGQVAGENFGMSVFLNNTDLIIGATLSQKVYRYFDDGESWVLSQTIVNPFTIGSFGASLYLYENQLMIGSTNVSSAGRAHYYERPDSSSDFTLVANFASGATGADLFGQSVAISGEFLIVGAPNFNSLNGLCFFYENIEGTWQNVGNLSAPNPQPNSEFGRSISPYGIDLVIGQPAYNDPITFNADVGRAYSFERYVTPQTLDLSCDSLFSEFQCYWSKVEAGLIYNMSYNGTYFQRNATDFTDFNSTTVTELFSSPNYSDVYGNEYYEIYIQAINTTTGLKGDFSSVSLTTRIDAPTITDISIQNMYSISLTWDVPNVQYISGDPNLDHYQIVYNASGIESQTETALNTDTTHLISSLVNNTNYSVYISACRTSACEGDDEGEVSSESIYTWFGYVENFNCTISNVITIDCIWDAPYGTRPPTEYILYYQNQATSESGLFSISDSPKSFDVNDQNQNYTVKIQACDSYGNCGPNVTQDVRTLLPQVIISTADAGVEEFNVSFVDISGAVKYEVSLDNSSSWQDFTSENDVGGTFTGIVSGISGNVQYNVTVRACGDSSCDFTGDASEVEYLTPDLGVVTNLDCTGISTGFNCTWSGLVYTTGLEGYGFQYGETFECLTPDTTTIQKTQMQGDLLLDIIIFASSDSVNCEYQTYSGANETTSVTTLPLQAPVITSYVELIEELDIYFDEVQGALGYQISTDDGSTWENFTTDYCGLLLGFEEETGRYGAGTPCEGDKTGLAGNQAMEVKLRACADTACTDSLAGPASNATTMTARLGDITGLSCTPEITGFSCNWDALTLAAGLVKYKLTYDGSVICIDNGTTTVNKTQLVGDHNFTITVLASASSTCSSDTYSGDASTTYVTSIELEAPNISTTNYGVEVIYVYFDEIAGAQNYQISIDGSWQSFTATVDCSVTKNMESGLKASGTCSGYVTPVEGNVEYSIAVRACANSSCTESIAGPAGESETVSAKLGNITGLSCSSETSGFSCSWDNLVRADGLGTFLLYYNSTYVCLPPGQLSFSPEDPLAGGDFYIISVSAQADSECTASDYSGLNSTTNVTTNTLGTPTITTTYSGEVEQVSFDFTKVTDAVNYAVSVDDGISWSVLDSTDHTTYLSGVVTGLDGNVDYSVKVRACADTDCTADICGPASSSETITPKIGNISGLACTSHTSGFNCSWDAIALNEGLNGYSLWYNDSLACIGSGTETFDSPLLPGDTYYDIYVSGSASSDCSSNDYSGYNSSTSLTTISIAAPQIVDWNLEWPDEIDINFTLIDSITDYLVSNDSGSSWYIPDWIGDCEEGSCWAEIYPLPGNYQYNIQIRACANSSCDVELAGLASNNEALTPILGDINNLECSPQTLGFYCSWDMIDYPDYLGGYYFDYNGTTKHLDPTQTYYNATDLPGSTLYEITVHACAHSSCDNDNANGYDSTTTITTNPLDAPTIDSTDGLIQTIGVSFDPVPLAEGYAAYIDDGNDWRILSNITNKGDYLYGYIENVPGNYEYTLRLRACGDDACTDTIWGPPSTPVLVTPRLGYVPNFQCEGIDLGFSCTWNLLDLDDYLEYYALYYGDECVLLGTDQSSFSIEGILGNTTYTVIIDASASSNCLYNQYSGPNTSIDVMTLPLSPPTIILSEGLVEKIYVEFTNVNLSKGYNISIDDGATWQSFSALMNRTSWFNGSISPVPGNHQYTVRVRGCSDTQCTFEYGGYASDPVYVTPLLGNIEGLSCTSQIVGFNCSWDPLTRPQYLGAYQFSYNGTAIPQCTNSTSVEANELLGNVTYQVNVFASDDDQCTGNQYYSGPIATVYVKTLPLGAPYIFDSDGGIEEIKTSIYPVEKAKNYMISLDNGNFWQNLSNVTYYENEVISIKTNLPGNVNYNVMMRACAEINCIIYYAGYPSNMVPIRPRLGNVSSLSCTSLIDGFSCTWNPLVLDQQLYAYQFRYGNETDCIPPDQTYYSMTGLEGATLYEIGVTSEAKSDCSDSDYTGVEITTSVYTNISAPFIFDSNAGIESLSVSFDPVSGAHGYLVTINNGSTWSAFDLLVVFETDYLEGTQINIAGNKDYQVAVKACVEDTCNPNFLGPISNIVPLRPSLGAIPNLSCSSETGGWSCTWDQIPFPANLGAFEFNYNGTTVCLPNTTLSYALYNLSSATFYSISIYASAKSNCALSPYSGPVSSTLVYSNIPEPIINIPQPGIEQFQLMIEEITGVPSFVVSLDNGTTWQAFSSLTYNEGYGTYTAVQTGLDGNIEYPVRVRACADAACTPAYFGPPTSYIVITPRLGYINNFICTPSISSFTCTWTPLALNDGLKGYTFKYNSDSICLDSSLSEKTVTDVEGATLYQVSINASAISGCYSNINSGPTSSTSVTPTLAAPVITSGSAGVESLTINFTPVPGAQDYRFSINSSDPSWIPFPSVIDYVSYWMATKNSIGGNIDYPVRVRACGDALCSTDEYGPISNTLTLTPKLGNISSFSCFFVDSAYSGINCTWTPPNYIGGMKAYCVATNFSTTMVTTHPYYYISLENIPRNQYISVGVYASASSDCSSNIHSGDPLTVQFYIPEVIVISEASISVVSHILILLGLVLFFLI
eukprot:Anaeramoba_ignava/a478273_2853.p1 GENE.a478273_2853~~a478273_2853.p1  ORF type:complete len:2778 (+),score=669.91 a478273_2853:82-8415(+)